MEGEREGCFYDTTSLLSDLDPPPFIPPVPRTKGESPGTPWSDSSDRDSLLMRVDIVYFFEKTITQVLLVFSGFSTRLRSNINEVEIKEMSSCQK